MAGFYLHCLFSILLTLSSTSFSQTVIESVVGSNITIDSSISTTVSQTVVESVVGSKITIGSSVSAGVGAASYWLSPSGLFSFGFYPLNCYNQVYIIGIWINNNPTQKTIVWSINRDDSPLSNATSLLLNHEGKFFIQFSNGAKQKPLFHQDSLFSSSISYASIHDNGNLVFYDSNWTIIWESFDYPTDTILPGQTLHPKQSLASSVTGFYQYRHMYHLIMKDSGNLMLYRMNLYHNCKGRGYVRRQSCNYDDIFVWESDTQTTNCSPVELKLDLTTGHLYLEDWNGLIKKSLYKGVNIDERDSLYRATLGRDGVFRLYKEKIGFELNSSTEVVVWDTERDRPGFMFEVGVFILTIIIVGGIILIYYFLIDPLMVHLLIRG